MIVFLPPPIVRRQAPRTVEGIDRRIKHIDGQIALIDWCLGLMIFAAVGLPLLTILVFWLGLWLALP